MEIQSGCHGRLVILITDVTCETESTFAMPGMFSSVFRVALGVCQPNIIDVVFPTPNGKSHYVLC